MADEIYSFSKLTEKAEFKAQLIFGKQNGANILHQGLGTILHHAFVPLLPEVLIPD